MAELLASLSGIGFADVRITHEFRSFDGTSKENTARHFGVIGVNVFARKPA